MVPNGMKKFMYFSKLNINQGDIRPTSSKMSGFKLLCTHAIMVEIHIVKN